MATDPEQTVNARVKTADCRRRADAQSIARLVGRPKIALRLGARIGALTNLARLILDPRICQFAAVLPLTFQRRACQQEAGNCLGRTEFPQATANLGSRCRTI